MGIKFQENYRAADGLPSDEFNARGCAMGLQGELIFGGVQASGEFGARVLPVNLVR